MKAGRVEVHLVFPHAASGEIATSSLTTEDESRAERFRFRDDARHWIACRASLRTILGEALQLPPQEVPLVVSPFGKPGLAPPFDWLHFNLSHCSDLALVVLSVDGPVGVDLENLGRAGGLLECESSFCHPEEIKALPRETEARASQLLRIWTAKEAVLKALGTGLSHPPEAVRIVFQQPASLAISDLPLAGIENQRLHPLDHPLLGNHRAVVSVPLDGLEIEII